MHHKWCSKTATHKPIQFYWVVELTLALGIKKYATITLMAIQVIVDVMNNFIKYISELI